MTDICCVPCIQCCQANLQYSHLEFNLRYLILPIPERPLGPWCECINHSASMQRVILLQFVIKKKNHIYVKKGSYLFFFTEKQPKFADGYLHIKT